MGPVNTKGSGYAVLNYTGEGYAYEIYLYNVYGIKNIELHVAAPGTHGDVVAVFYAAAFQNPSQVTNGVAAKGTLVGHDFLGPLLLPLAVHLPASLLEDRYVSTGNAVVVVHTLANEGGELGAWLPTSKAMGPMAGMRMGGQMGPIASVSAPAPANSMGATSMASGQSMHG
ncbi:g1192 [Coccomyxa elongata]